MRCPAVSAISVLGSIAGLHDFVTGLTSSWGSFAMRDSMSTNFGEAQ
jgi:hypothetical protein